MLILFFLLHALAGLQGLLFQVYEPSLVLLGILLSLLYVLTTVYTFCCAHVSTCGTVLVVIK